MTETPKKKKKLTKKKLVAKVKKALTETGDLVVPKPTKPPTTSTSPPKSTTTPTPKPALGPQPEVTSPEKNKAQPTITKAPTGAPPSLKSPPTAPLGPQKAPVSNTHRANPGAVQKNPKAVPKPVNVGVTNFPGSHPGIRDDSAILAASSELIVPGRPSKSAADLRKKHAPAWLIDIRGRLVNQGILAVMDAVNLKRFQKWPEIDTLMIRLVGAGLQVDSQRYVEAVKWWTAKAGRPTLSGDRKGRLAARLAAIDAISAITNQAAHFNAIADAAAKKNATAARKALVAMAHENASEAAAADRAEKAKAKVAGPGDS